ncbi:VTT domain-containing protein [Candidatus Parcubacteria bacterium]|nr:VTT domain-containing protein [Candidatus Parcubacteria bacterium]
MLSALHFVDMAKATVIDPSPASFMPLFIFSFLNDLIGVFPFALVLAGQLVFYHGAFTAALWMKLLVFVALPVGLGSALGSVPLYFLAYYGGKKLINKWHRFFRFSWEDVEKVNAYFKGTWYDELVFLVLRCAPVLPSIPLDIASGILRMRFLPFFVLTAAGSIARMMLTLLAVGMSLSGFSGLSRF